MIRREHDLASNKGALVVTFQSQTWCHNLMSHRMPPTSATPTKKKQGKTSPGRPRLGTNPGEAPGVL